jgi:hypothetical protein
MLCSVTGDSEVSLSIAQNPGGAGSFLWWHFQQLEQHSFLRRRFGQSFSLSIILMKFFGDGSLQSEEMLYVSFREDL